MSTKQREVDPLDQTVAFPVVASGVTERRIREEAAAYEARLDQLRRTYEQSVNLLNSVFTSRVRAIAADPFVKFDTVTADSEPNMEVTK